MNDGVGRVGLRDVPISPGDLLDDVSASAGAVVTFEGRVRDRNDGRTVIGLHYDAYQEMAEDVLEDIQRRTCEAFPVSFVGLLHRVGTLSVGETAVVVTVTAAHRSAAFDAARFAVEAIKAELPVWKQEEYEDGSRGWLDGDPTKGGPTA